MRVRVTAPASAGNTGSAFDSLGLAFDLYNEVVLDTARPGVLVVEGEGAEALHQGGANLVVKAIERFEAEKGSRLPPYGLELVNRISFGRGLGSSAAAIVGGLLAADAVAGTELCKYDLLRMAASLEGHPDNVAPALYGGAVLTVQNEGEVNGPLTVVPFGVPSDWRAVLYVPDMVIPTHQARAILPLSVPRADALFNHSRVGLLVAAITQRRPELLRVAMQDRIHQPYRAKIFPPMDALIRAALDGGAWGSCLSGAGSAILAISSEAMSSAVAAAMQGEAKVLGVPGRSLILGIPSGGARREILDPAP